MEPIVITAMDKQFLESDELQKVILSEATDLFVLRGAAHARIQEELMLRGFSKTMANRIAAVARISARQNGLILTASPPKLQKIKSAKTSLKILTPILWCAAAAIMAGFLLMAETDSSNWPLFIWALFLSIGLIAIGAAQLE